MSDPVSAAKSARESLARALAAIQSDPAVPPHVIAIAEPISNAMGALFQVERSGGAAAGSHGPVALEAVRRALGLLQQQPSNHPSLQIALEAVAGSLSLVHGLARAAPPPQAPQQPAYQPAPQQQYAPQPQAAYPQQTAPARPQAYPAGPPAQQPAPVPQQFQRGPQPQDAYAATFVAPMGAQAFQQAAQQPPQPHHQPAPAQQPHRPPPAGGGPVARIEAELGTHSASNFFKGLSGNDVVEHGGLFVATYKIPPIGQTVNLHISMPGGYEFDAVAVVRWTRETVDSAAAGGATAQPGFGAQFTQIAPEARQLVYRYVRNREPLFHDDL